METAIGNGTATFSAECGSELAFKIKAHYKMQQMPILTSGSGFPVSEK